MVFNLFHVKGLPKLHVIWPPDPHVIMCCFRDNLQETKIRVEKPIREYIFKRACFFLGFSKIADLQARSAALGAALRACRSAVFQTAKEYNSG